MKTLAATLIACVLGFTLRGPGTTWTCECPSRLPPIEALADSTLVLRGRVTQIVPPQPSLRLLRSFPFFAYDTPFYAPLTVRLAVSRVWQGPAYTTVTLQTGQSYSGCGVSFQEGGDYLVYTYENGAGALMTHRCSRTALARDAAGDLALFGAGRAPTMPGPATPLTSTQIAVSLCMAPIVLALIALGALLVRRRARHSVVS
jgi:hypothetical protein